MTDSDNYRLIVEEHRGYLFACVEAKELSPSLILEYQQRIATQIQKHNYRRILIKRDVPLSHNPAELYTIPFIVDSSNIRGIKYAFVDVKPEHMSTYKLALLHSKLNGLIIEVFSDVESAERWLLED